MSGQKTTSQKFPPSPMRSCAPSARASGSIFLLGPPRPRQMFLSCCLSGPVRPLHLAACVKSAFCAAVASPEDSRLFSCLCICVACRCSCVHGRHARCVHQPPGAGAGPCLSACVQFVCRCVLALSGYRHHRQRAFLPKPFLPSICHFFWGPPPPPCCLARPWLNVHTREIQFYNGIIAPHHFHVHRD
jgi:hypothetical protein